MSVEVEYRKTIEEIKVNVIIQLVNGVPQGEVAKVIYNELPSEKVEAPIIQRR